MSNMRSVKKKRFANTIWFMVAILLAIMTIYPFLWMIATSFKPMVDIYARPLSLIPNPVTMENYQDVMRTVPFGKYFLNSILLASVGMLTNVLFGSLAGYAFAKIRFDGRKVVFAILLSSMMIPSIVTLVPQFIVLRKFPFAGGNDWMGQGGTGFINSFWAILLPGGVGTFAVFFMKQFMSMLPDELGESARLDGCGELRIFLSVYLPLAIPAAITLSIMTFQSGWNSFMWPLIVLNDSNKYTVQIGLSLFKNNYSTNYGAMMAGTVISTLPVLGVFIFAQKYYVEGIALSGTKG